MPIQVNIWLRLCCEFIGDQKKVPKRTDFTYIDTEEALQALVDDIVKTTDILSSGMFFVICLTHHIESRYNVIGVDMENESMFSYNGYLWLIQISTLTHDYVIDLLSINSPKFIKQTLGEKVFENHSVIKILHGCSSDVAWIWRDFKVGIVNVFDTQDIYQQLGGKKLALNHLWDVFWGYSMDSETKVMFQKSSWSQRPLSTDMLNYAATDSRYLIYLRYKLIELALRKSSDKKLKLSNSPMNIKAMNKLYDKMQKHHLIDSNVNDIQKVLKKATKGKSDNLKYSVVYYFKKLYESREEYWKEHDINSDIVCNFKYLYDISLKPKNYEKILSNLSIEDNNIPEVLLKHRNQVFKNITEIMEIHVSEEDMKTDDVLRLFKYVAIQILISTQPKSTTINLPN